MTDSHPREALLRDALFGGSATTEFLPPLRALRALRRRRRQRRAVRTVVAAAALIGLLFSSRWALRQEVETPNPSEIAPDWLVRTQDLAAGKIVRTALTPDVVRTPLDLPTGLVVHTRRGLYTPLSDEGLLALLADWSPVLIGAPGERRLIFQSDDIAR